MINLFYDENDLIDSGVSVSEYRDMVKHPGKFEGEPAYVPYIWDHLMLWGEVPDYEKSQEIIEAWGYTEPEEDESGFDVYGDYCDMPEVYGYDVDLIDYVLFPELLEAGIVKVYLYEDDQGFVNVYEEITIPSWEDYWLRHIDNFQTVKDIDPDYVLATDSQEILAIGESIGVDVSNYGCLFVRLGEGEYTSVYGCESIVPYNYMRVDKLW